MKSIYLFCTKLWFYLTEIPVITLLWIAVKYNSKSEDLFGFYPLIIFLFGVAIFIAVYFFRMISISTDEIRYHGLFSSRDREFIQADRSLVIKICRGGNLRITLFGDAGAEPPFDWMKPEDVQYREICLFRGRALGTARTVRKIAKYFSVDDECLGALLDEGFSFENDAVSVYTETVDEIKTVKISFKITIL